MGGELLARNPQTAPIFKETVRDPFLDFISQGTNEVSLDSIVTNITTAPLQNNSAKEITVFAKEGLGDFEKVRKIIFENKAAFMQMSSRIMQRARILQVACCPPGQNTASLSRGSVKAEFLRVSSHDRLSDKDHQHCPKCGMEIGANGCPKCTHEAVQNT